MKKNIIYAFFISLALFLSACGSNDKSDKNLKDFLNTKVFSAEASSLKIDNNLDFSTSIPFKKLEGSDLKIEFSNFNLNLTGCELVGPVVYSPSPLILDGGKDSQKSITVSGKVKEDCNATGYQLSADKKITLEGQSSSTFGEDILNVTLTADGNPIGSGSPSNPNNPTGNENFTLSNITPSITVKKASQKAEIMVDLVDAKNNYVPGKEIKITSLGAFGSVDAGTATTNEAGRAIFNYTAPSDLTPIDGKSKNLNLTYTDENNNTITTAVTISIQSSIGGGTTLTLTNATTPLIINNDNEVKTISVDVVDSSGVGVADQNVSITVVNGVNFGSITSASTVKSGQNGKVNFFYKAPANVAAVDGQSTTVTLSMINNGISSSKDVTLKFVKVDVNITVPIVVIANDFKEINLTSNSQPVEMQIQVFEEGTNAPYTKGNVKVTLPPSVVNGVNVGRFSEYIVAVGTDGIATFNYTGAQDLQALIASNEKNATFQFFHEDNPSKQESITVIYNLENNYIPANYLLTTSSSDNNQTMGLLELKTFTLYLKDDQGTLIPNADITKVTITSQNTLIGKLRDETNGGNAENTLVFNGIKAINSKSFPIQTYTQSGLLPIEIIVEFKDGNGDTVTRTTIMNVVVFSGPPTAMSISYAGVEQNNTIAKYIEKFVVTVTDTYNNAVNTRPYVAVGAMVEYAVDGSSPTGARGEVSPRLWHGAFDTKGTLNPIGGDKAQFETANNDFSYVDFNNDRLVLFGSGFVYEALGKWDIKDSGSANILSLKDDYRGDQRDNLSFAVGHNNRQDLCRADSRQYVGNMKATNYQLDATGHALVEFEYDYHLTGKDIMVWTNLTGFQADNNTTGRLGESLKHTLRGNGLNHAPEGGYALPKGASGLAKFEIWHENAPERYRNGHFAHAIAGGSTCGYRRVKSSNFIYDANGDSVSAIDARVCNNGGSTKGRAYITYYIQAPADKACTFNITRINVATEF